MNPSRQERLERQLKQLQPSPARSEELDLVYRCGWEAALAAHRRSDSGKVEWEVRSRSWLLPFSGGTLAGLALSVLLIVSLAPRGESNGPSQQTADNRASDVHDGPRAHVPQATTTSDPEVEQRESRDLQLTLNSMRRLFGATMLLPPAGNLKEPILEPVDHSELEESAALSPVAKHSWGDSLSSSGRAGASPNVLVQRNRRLPSIGELMFGTDNHEIY